MEPNTSSVFARPSVRLGTRYDVREFHDAMLLPGALLPELLERI